MSINLTKSQIDLIKNIVLKKLPKAKIYLFGSRVKKINHKYSDVDIAIDNDQKIPLQTFYQIKEDLTESALPYKVDILDIKNTEAKFLLSIIKELVDIN